MTVVVGVDVEHVVVEHDAADRAEHDADRTADAAAAAAQSPTYADAP